MTDNHFTKLESLAKIINRCYGLNYHISFYNQNQTIAAEYSSIQNISKTPNLSMDELQKADIQEQEYKVQAFFNFKIPRDYEIIKINMNSENEIANYIFSCFEEIQQAACKKVAKSWIKIIEPTKQSQHPYKEEDSSKPDWWPVGVIHKEPDHLKKLERIKLLRNIAKTFRNLYFDLIEEALQLPEFKEKKTKKPILRMELILKQIFKLLINPNNEAVMKVFRVGKNFSNKTILKARQEYIARTTRNQENSSSSSSSSSDSMLQEGGNTTINDQTVEQSPNSSEPVEQSTNSSGYLQPPFQDTSIIRLPANNSTIAPPSSNQPQNILDVTNDPNILFDESSFLNPNYYSASDRHLKSTGMSSHPSTNTQNNIQQGNPPVNEQYLLSSANSISSFSTPPQPQPQQGRGNTMSCNTKTNYQNVENELNLNSTPKKYFRNKNPFVSPSPAGSNVNNNPETFSSGTQRFVDSHDDYQLYRYE